MSAQKRRPKAVEAWAVADSFGVFVPEGIFRTKFDLRGFGLAETRHWIRVRIIPVRPRASRKKAKGAKKA